MGLLKIKFEGCIFFRMNICTINSLEITLLKVKLNLILINLVDNKQYEP